MPLLRYRSLRLGGLSLIMLLVVLSSGNGCGSTRTQPSIPTTVPTSIPTPVQASIPTPVPTTPPTTVTSISHSLLAVPSSSIPLSGEWRFAVDPDGVGETQGWADPGFDDSAWSLVTVPHTWNVMPEHSNFNGLGWYRRRFKLPATAQDAHIRLRFEAVYYQARVWLNGQYLGEHKGGYTPFEFDVSEIVELDGENVVVVQADNIRSTDRIPTERVDWWNYGGIVRDVSLEISSRAFVSRQQIVAIPHLVAIDNADTATITTTVTIHNAFTEPFEGTINGDVLDEATGASVLSSLPTSSVSLPPGHSADVQLTATISMPKLWHFDHPHLYRWSASLLSVDGQTLHADEETFGVRLVELKDAQFYLNGEPVRLVGLTRHADSPEHGLAETVTVMAADYDDLKRLNMVFSRPVHYPQAEFIFDYCDLNGILLIPEIPTWQLSQEQMANPDMRELSRQQLREMITANFNHPSVWAWSVTNEVASDTQAGRDYIKDMIAFTKSLDPIRPVSFASYRLYHTLEIEDEATKFADFVMMNEYYGSWAGPKDGLSIALDRIHATWPDKPVIISEFGLDAYWNTYRWSPRDTGDPSEFYSIPEGQPADSEATDIQRRLVITEQMDVFRRKPFVVGAIFWTYQDYRTPTGFKMGLVGDDRKPRTSWSVLREEYSPVLIDSVTFSPTSGDSRSATVSLRTRGPVEEDMPAYTLRGYSLHWAVTSPEDDETFSEDDLPLPTLAPATTWSGVVEWAVPEAEYVFALSIVRPTGFSVIERSYDSQGKVLPPEPS